jgi:hypothetical protein
MLNLSFDTFALLNEHSTNDAFRPGTLLFEYHEESITITSSEGTAEIPTKLGEVLGLIDLNYVAVADDPTDSIQLLTDGVIASDAVTVNLLSAAVADGATKVRFFLVGTRSESQISVS